MSYTSLNSTLLDKVRSMLQDVSLPESYWYDALDYAVLLHNVTPTRALESRDVVSDEGGLTK